MRNLLCLSTVVRLSTVVTVPAALAALLLAPGVASAATYQRVCETTGISRTPGATPTYTVYAGNNVNVRSIQGGWAKVNYPTPGYLPADTLCSRR